MELPSPDCADCAVLKALLDKVQGLENRVIELEARVRQTSRNSSRPPSSDPPEARPPSKRKPSGRKQGGQPGHEGHHRPLLAESEVDRVVPLLPSTCGRCGRSLPPIGDGKPVRKQVWELPPIRPSVTEYQFQGVVCPCCGERTVAMAGPDVPEGDFGALGRSRGHRDDQADR